MQQFQVIALLECYGLGIGACFLSLTHLHGSTSLDECVAVKHQAALNSDAAILGAILGVMSNLLQSTLGRSCARCCREEILSAKYIGRIVPISQCNTECQLDISPKLSRIPSAQAISRQ